MEGETNNSAKRKKRPFLTTFVVLFVFLLVLVIAAIAFPGVALRYVFSRVETQTGIAVTFDRAYFYLADGSFLNIDGLTVKRQNHHVSSFDLRVESVQIPAMFPADFRRPVLLVTGLRGTIERVGSEPTEETAEIPIKTLMLNDAQIDFIDRTLEKPFLATIQIERFSVTHAPLLHHRQSLFEPYVCDAFGKIGPAPFFIGPSPVMTNPPGEQIVFVGVPFGLLAPYAPVLDDIFVSGSMNIQIDNRSDSSQKKVRVSITLLPDCEIKPANEILAPAIQAALRQLDNSSVPDLQDLQGRIERLRTTATSLRADVDRIARIVGTFIALAPRDVREQYESVKSQYDQITSAYDEWNTKFETILRELDHVKVRIVEDTFQAFVDSGTSIEIDLQEVDGEWQYNGYDVVIRLIEQNYRTIIAAQYQSRIQEIRDAVDRLLVP